MRAVEEVTQVLPTVKPLERLKGLVPAPMGRVWEGRWCVEGDDLARLASG